MATRTISAAQLPSSWAGHVATFNVQLMSGAEYELRFDIRTRQWSGSETIYDEDAGDWRDGRELTDVEALAIAKHQRLIVCK